MMHLEAPLISESVTVNTRFRLEVRDTGIVSRCAASRCRPSRRLRANKSKRRHVHNSTPVHVSGPTLPFHTPISQSRLGLFGRPAGRQSFPSFSFLIWRLHAPKRDGQHRTIWPHSYGSFPLISSPSQRHEFVRPVCRIHLSSLPGFMRGSRLHWLRAALSQRRVYIVFLPAQDVKSRFGQVSGYRANRLGMAFALL